MNTTNLFVELVVIGASAAAWFLVLVLSLFGYRWMPFSEPISLSILVALIPLIYVLGIVTDRLADVVFDRIWANKLRTAWFSSKTEYYHARAEILNRSEYISNMLEYGRSRLRICRGWTFNLVLAAVCLNLLIWLQFGDQSWAPSVAVFGTISILLLALLCWYAWRSLAISEYRKIKDNVDGERVKVV